MSDFDPGNTQSPAALRNCPTCVHADKTTWPEACRKCVRHANWQPIEPMQQIARDIHADAKDGLQSREDFKRQEAGLPPLKDMKASGGGKLSGDHYYRVRVVEPIAPDVQPYTAECSDIIEALNMTFNEGEAFKAIWRLAAGRQGRTKNKPQYDADKAAHYGGRIAVQTRRGT